MDIQSVVDLKPNENVAQFGPGDTVKVSFRIVEGERERTQTFTGIVIRVRRSGAGANFTVRQLLHGIGVERTFPFYSPLLEKVVMVSHGHARRAKLFYLRGLSRKKTRMKMRAR